MIQTYINTIYFAISVSRFDCIEFLIYFNIWTIDHLFPFAFKNFSSTYNKSYFNSNNKIFTKFKINKIINQPDIKYSIGLSPITPPPFININIIHFEYTNLMYIDESMNCRRGTWEDDRLPKFIWCTFLIN